MKNLGYYNGKFDEIEKIFIPMSDRVCYFGDGIYDATYSRNYKIYSLNEHIDRFFNSAKLLNINIKQTKNQLKGILYNLINEMDTDENFVYFQATRGNAITRNHTFINNLEANIWINIFHKKICDVYKKVNVITMEDTRFLHCNIKTLNLIPSVIAAQKAKEKNCEETIFHRNGRVTECAHSNVHILKDGSFITAPLDNLILPGIARKHLITECQNLKIPVYERAYSLEELFNADEVIISSAGQLCTGINEIDGKKIGGKSPVLLKSLQDNVYNKFIKDTN